MPVGILILAILLISGAGYGYLKYQIRTLRAKQEQVVKSLKKEDYKITIPEGWRREEIAKVLETTGICSADSFMQASAGKEGYLFPDTYRFYHNTPAIDVVSAMTSNFTKRMDGMQPTANQVILASIIEREAKYDNERAPIAGVYMNRLKINMLLEADPTVQYARDNTTSSAAHFTYWTPITQADYHSIDSPYNTYLYKGLPPTAIDNPGRPSIIAAMNPEVNPYYYFFQNNGKIFLSKTLSEHLSKLSQR
jgi:UPF0755 protein